MIEPKNNKSSGPTSEPNLVSKRRYEFEGFEFFPAKHLLLYNGVECKLDPKMIKLLILLIESYPNHVSKEHLTQQLWPDTSVSDWSLSKLVSDTRKLLESEGQSLIKTLRGQGYVFAVKVDEIIDAYPRGQDNRPKESLPKNISLAVEESKSGSQQIAKLNRVLIIAAVIALLLAVIIVVKPTADQALPNDLTKANHQGKNHILAVMQQIQKNLTLTNTTFMAQYRRRKELETLLIAKRPETEKLSAEKKMMVHYPTLTKDEMFIFDQIRALTEGPLYKGNHTLLVLLEKHPEVYQQIDSFKALYNHLSIWENKYHRIFEKRKDMSLVYVGVEDGVPFPSEVDELVDKWIKETRSSQE